MTRIRRATDAGAAPVAHTTKVTARSTEKVRADVDGEAAWVKGRTRVSRAATEAHDAATVKSEAHAVGASSPLFLGHVVDASPHAPKKKLRAAFRELRRALTTSSGEALDLDGAAAKLRALGFTRARGAKGADGSVRFTRGKETVTLTPLALAHLPAIRVRVERAGHAGHTGGVAVAGIVLRDRHWRLLAERYDEELARFVRAVEGTRSKKLPSTFEGLKRFLDAGLDPDAAARRADRKAELDARLGELTKVLVALREEGRAPKGVVIYVCGPDGAGKSSTGGIVMKAFADAGYTLRHDSFKAPTPEERAQHWLKRYERGLPAEGEAFFWDRGPAGDIVYGDVDRKTERRRAKELMGFEARLADEGILFVKVELHASKDRQAATFGKRLARQHLADRLGAALDARGRLGAKARAGLDDIAAKIGPGDLQALARYDRVEARYEGFIARTEENAPWIVLDATQRHDARLALVDGVQAAVARFAER